MSMDLVVSALTAIGIVGALLFSSLEVRSRAQQERKRDQEERQRLSLDLHRDMTLDGDTAAAFHRLSLILRGEGTATYGRATWRLLTDSDLAPGGLLDQSDPDRELAYTSFARTLWFFQRSEMAVSQGLAAEATFYELCGFHVWWWNQAYREIHGPTALTFVRSLSARVETWARASGQLDEWKSRCAFDFDGGPAR